MSSVGLSSSIYTPYTLTEIKKDASTRTPILFVPPLHNFYSHTHCTTTYIGYSWRYPFSLFFFPFLFCLHFLFLFFQWRAAAVISYLFYADVCFQRYWRGQKAFPCWDAEEACWDDRKKMYQRLRFGDLAAISPTLRYCRTTQKVRVDTYQKPHSPFQKHTHTHKNLPKQHF